MADLETYKRQALEQEKRLSQQVSVRDGHIVINITFEYNIALSRCRSHSEILAWTLHLTEKNWMTMEVLERFIRVACHENGLELPHP